MKTKKLLFFCCLYSFSAAAANDPIPQSDEPEQGQDLRQPIGERPPQNKWGRPLFPAKITPRNIDEARVKGLRAKGFRGYAFDQDSEESIVGKVTEMIKKSRKTFSRLAIKEENFPLGPEDLALSRGKTKTLFRALHGTKNLRNLSFQLETVNNNYKGTIPETFFKTPSLIKRLCPERLRFPVDADQPLEKVFRSLAKMPAFPLDLWIEGGVLSKNDSPTLRHLARRLKKNSQKEYQLTLSHVAFEDHEGLQAFASLMEKLGVSTLFLNECKIKIKETTPVEKKESLLKIKDNLTLLFHQKSLEKLRIFNNSDSLLGSLDPIFNLPLTQKREPIFSVPQTPPSSIKTISLEGYFPPIQGLPHLETLVLNPHKHCSVANLSLEGWCANPNLKNLVLKKVCFDYETIGSLRDLTGFILLLFPEKGKLHLEMGISMPYISSKRLINLGKFKERDELVEACQFLVSSICQSKVAELVLERCVLPLKPLFLLSQILYQESALETVYLLDNAPRKGYGKDEDEKDFESLKDHSRAMLEEVDESDAPFESEESEESEASSESENLFKSNESQSEEDCDEEPIEFNLPPRENQTIKQLYYLEGSAKEKERTPPEEEARYLARWVAGHKPLETLGLKLGLKCLSAFYRTLKSCPKENFPSLTSLKISPHWSIKPQDENRFQDLKAWIEELLPIRTPKAEEERIPLQEISRQHNDIQKDEDPSHEDSPNRLYKAQAPAE